MSEVKNNKELVAAGHEFARLMSSDTPIIDMAKMVTQLAERLDCTTVALREMTKQRDAHLEAEKIWEKTMIEACGEDGPASVAGEIRALREKRDFALASVREQCDTLAADNVARADIIGRLVWQYSASGIRPVKNSLNPASALLFDALEVLRQSVTAAAINEIKAQGVETAAASYHPLVVTGGSDDPQENGLCIREDLLSIARKLRGGEIQP